jgi:hypothetical protein
MIGASIFGGLAGIAIGFAVKFYFLDPYLQSLSYSHRSVQEKQVLADNLRRDQMVADELAKLDKADVQTKKMACTAYIGGLREQNLVISPIINAACSET